MKIEISKEVLTLQLGGLTLLFSIILVTEISLILNSKSNKENLDRKILCCSLQAQNLHAIQLFSEFDSGCYKIRSKTLLVKHVTSDNSSPQCLYSLCLFKTWLIYF